MITTPEQRTILAAYAAGRSQGELTAAGYPAALVDRLIRTVAAYDRGRARYLVRAYDTAPEPPPNPAQTAEITRLTDQVQELVRQLRVARAAATRARRERDAAAAGRDRIAAEYAALEAAWGERAAALLREERFGSVADLESERAGRAA